VDNRWITGGSDVDNFQPSELSTGYPHSYPPVFHIFMAHFVLSTKDGLLWTTP